MYVYTDETGKETVYSYYDAEMAMRYEEPTGNGYCRRMARELLRELRTGERPHVSVGTPIAVLTWRN